jgi:hypothetical protein
MLIGSVDLGQSVDYTAFAAVDLTRRQDGDAYMVTRYAVRRLRRWPLGTTYHTIADDLKAQFAAAPLKGCTLLVDVTGVGAAVYEIFRKAGIKAVLRPVLITAGHQVTPKAGGWHVPKRELAGALVAAFQARRVGIAAGLPEAEVLAKELANFRVKVTPAGNETFEALREGDKDDLVLAVAMAVWYGERWQPPGLPSGGGRQLPRGPEDGPGVWR